MAAMNPFMAQIGGVGSSDEQKKDLRALEHRIVDICTKQCTRRERQFHKDSDICHAKCYDMAFVYAR
eukprot:CAMPEP_0170498286 /NCGR_PEP_ID=MMETSP0208-20121228/27365_1 /TAXON_ID=197538 /ORGANISM="Strombidium inclinatum, Strain S3" /LENGTH=66 /DNA_ID=CAMNT_0010775417 /DNA_START=193 /DNA_END=390 /DNA_ORIENTATION=-